MRIADIELEHSTLNPRHSSQAQEKFSEYKAPTGQTDAISEIMVSGWELYYLKEAASVRGALIVIDAELFVPE
jgi:hypothetical protein